MAPQARSFFTQGTSKISSVPSILIFDITGAPVDPASVELAPDDAADPEPDDSTLVEAAPADSAPVELAPDDSALFELAPPEGSKPGSKAGLGRRQAGMNATRLNAGAKRRDACGMAAHPSIFAPVNM